MSVLYDPRAAMTETQRSNADALMAARRRLDAAAARERAEAAANSVACFDKMIQAMEVEARPLPAELVALEPVAATPVEWFEVEEEIIPEVRHVTIADIQRAVATRYNVTRGDLMSSRRTANIVRPRQIGMYLARTITLRSLPEIGRRFGGRDHTTILHAVRKIAALVETDEAVAEDVRRLSLLVQEMA